MEKQIGTIKFKSKKNEWDVYFDMALRMLTTILENNAANKKTVMIVPVGPTDQYPILAAMVNTMKVSLRNVHFFNMDEYLITPEQCIDENHFMSFHKRMNDSFYSLVDKELVMPESQRHFPMPGQIGRAHV